MTEEDIIKNKASSKWCVSQVSNKCMCLDGTVQFNCLYQFLSPRHYFERAYFLIPWKARTEWHLRTIIDFSINQLNQFREFQLLQSIVSNEN